MGKTQFKEITYTVNGLVESIALGKIGLPDLQRPFVWPNKKVRDLLDSMYRGYPVGYLLFWENPTFDEGKAIGSKKKQVAPQTLVIDGQQRLTSLYAVLKDEQVVRENFSKESIQIAFHPLEEEFKVADAAIKRDPAWIPDVSILWNGGPGLFQIAKSHIDGLSKNREVSAEEEETIQQSITRLTQIADFPFTALSLSSETDEESVADIFVRINSKGKSLNQADFILTLMSVYRDHQRKELEAFCAATRTPAKSGASPYNYYIEPDPDHLLRVAVGLAFRRARLVQVYSILRGKDLETGEFSAERRDEQFEELQKAQDYALDLGNWQEFFKCLLLAGYRTGKYISSKTNILYSYVFYLIAKRDYGLKGPQLRKAIARWFAFVSLTSRYTGSSESEMEADLANLRNVSDADGLLAYIDRTIASSLTSDYWSITLPNDLETSASRSPSLFAYYAALNVLQAKALFSELTVSDLMDPVIQGTRKSLERHHLFPRNYLKSNGFPSTRDTNQIANFALIEWEANADISDESPAEYWNREPRNEVLKETDKKYRELVDEDAAYWHALIEGWQDMEYREFLEVRRNSIARVIRDGFEALSSGAVASDEAPVVEVDPPLPREQFLEDLSPPIRPYIEPLLEEPIGDFEELRNRSQRYLVHLEGKVQFEDAELDIDTATLVQETLDRLLTATRDSDEEIQHIAQAAAQYFFLDADADADSGERGFGDDLQVVRAAETLAPRSIEQE